MRPASPTAPQVVVVGSVNVDLVVRVDALPAPGETVLGRRLERHGGGKGANAAVAAVRAGAEVHLVAAVGADDLGAVALDGLRSDQVDVSHVAVRPDESTGAALITVAPDGENQITVAAGANATLDPAHVSAALAELLPTTGCVLVGTEIAPAATRVAVRAAHAAGVPCVLNPAPVRPGLPDALRPNVVLTPNAGECRALADQLGIADAPLPVLAAALAERVRGPVVVTLGAAGLLVCSPGASPVPVPAAEVEVVDATGAGDVVNGVLAAQLAAGDDLLTAARSANRAAGRAVTRPGAR